MTRALLYKGWLETRSKLLLLAILNAFYLWIVYAIGSRSHGLTPAILEVLVPEAAWNIGISSAILAGTGAVTQPGFRSAKGLHGSTYFTLSLPVSRLRLLLARTAVGWLEMATMLALLCGGLAILLRMFGTVDVGDVFRQVITLAVCGSAFYGIAVLLAAVLDEQWRVWGGFLVFGGLWWLSGYLPKFDDLNVFQAMGERSPLLVHTMPWRAMALSLAVAGGMVLAAWKVGEHREY